MTELTDKDKAEIDEMRKKWETILSSGQSATTKVIELPMKISVSPGGAVQIDHPFALAGFERAGTQRTYLEASPAMLRLALEALEKTPGEWIELTQKPAAH